MSANTTLLQLGLITRTILGNTGRVQGSCVRVGGVGVLLCSSLAGGRMAGPVGAATMVDSWHKMGFSLKYETACAALCQTHTGRDTRSPILPNSQRPAAADPKQHHTDLLSSPQRPTVLIWGAEDYGNDIAILETPSSQFQAHKIISIVRCSIHHPTR